MESKVVMSDDRSRDLLDLDLRRFVYFLFTTYDIGTVLNFEGDTPPEQVLKSPPTSLFEKMATLTPLEPCYPLQMVVALQPLFQCVTI